MNTFSCKFVETLPGSIYCFCFHGWKVENEIICLVYHRFKNREWRTGGGAADRCPVATVEVAGRKRTCFLFSWFTNCSACRHRASAGKCKVAQLPRDLTAHVKVGDDYNKMVCILPPWEIKRLATSVSRAAPLLPSSSFPFTPLPFSLFCRLKREHGWKTRETMAHKSCADNTQAD